MHFQLPYHFQHVF